jgi:hypothetical protein
MYLLVLTRPILCLFPGAGHQEILNCVVLSAYQEKIPATNAIYEHAQDFLAGDEMLLAILKAFIPQPLTKLTNKSL